MTDEFYQWAILATPFLILFWNSILSFVVYKMRKDREGELLQSQELDNHRKELTRLASTDKRHHDQIDDLKNALSSMPGLDVIEALKGDLKAVNLNITGLSKSLDEQTDQQAKLTADRERLFKLESHIEHFPDRVASHEDVEKVHSRVSDLRGVVDEVAHDVDDIGRKVAATSATMESINGNLNLLNKSEFLKQGRDDD